MGFSGFRNGFLYFNWLGVYSFLVAIWTSYTFSSNQKLLGKKQNFAAVKQQNSMQNKIVSDTWSHELSVTDA